MAGFATLKYFKHGRVARISLNRPEVLNAFNIQMRDDVWEALAAVEDDPDVGALLVTGEGRAFCAGADLTEFGSAPSPVIARDVRWERDVWGRWNWLSKPVVAAVHGYCIGSGLEMVLLSDLRLAAADTVFAMPEVRLGMIPAAGGTQTLARSRGRSSALDLLFTGRRFDAAEALRLKLVTRVLPEERLLDEAMSLAESLAAADPTRMAALRTAVKQGADLPLDAGLRLENRLAALGLGELSG
jgi:enoyl-CoA hydratase/carnithine racemase